MPNLEPTHLRYLKDANIQESYFLLKPLFRGINSLKKQYIWGL